MSIYVKGSGNPNAQLMIIGNFPDKVDEEVGECFKGAAGEFLWEICEELDIFRSSIWSTNVYKFRPPSPKRISEVCNPDEQVSNLWNEIQSINPNTILALGEVAFKTLTGLDGITKWRGSVVRSLYQDKKVIGTIHPTNLIRQREWAGIKPWPYIWKFIVQGDIERALIQSKFPEFNLPQRYVTIVRDSMQLSRIIERNRSRSRMSSDIESINGVPVCMGIAFDKHEAYVIPLFNRNGNITIGSVPSSDQAFIWQNLDKLLKEKDIVGQNYKYDQEKMEMIGFTYRRGKPIISDTLIKCHTIMPELPSKRMEMQQSIWTDLPYHKDEGKNFNPKKDRIDKFFHYCGFDALSTFETDESQEQDLIEMSDEFHVDVIKFYYDYMMQLHEIYLDMERVGFLLDKVAQDSLKIKYLNLHDLVQARFTDNLPEFFPPKKSKLCHGDHKVNVANHGVMKNLIYGHLAIPERKRFGTLSCDEDTIVALLNNTVKDERKRAVLTDIIEDRRIRKTLGTYVLSKPDYDGRIRGTYRIVGTETARSSTAILKPPIRPVKSGHAFQTLTKHGTIGADIRTMYKVDEGFVIVQLDLSQAEPRIVSVLSQDWELLKAFDSGKVDIHRRTAALVLDMVSELDLSENWNEVADILDKDGGERFLGKKSRNGVNYDMGNGELAVNIATDAKRFGKDVSVSEWRAGKMIDNLHRCSPNIRGVFHRDIQDAINGRRALVNPYGRVRRFMERLEKPTYGEGYAHIPQSTVADHMKHSLILIKKEMSDFRKLLMGESHDSAVFRFPIGEWEDRARVCKGIMERPISFRQCTLARDVDLIIPADCEIGENNYRDLKKVKL